MVAPVTGPFLYSSQGGGVLAGSWYITKKGYRQAKPYDIPLPYDALYRTTLSASAAGGGVVETPSLAGISNPTATGSGFTLYSNRLDYSSPVVQEAISRARAKFSDKVRPTSEMLVNLIQAREAASMITRRASDLLKFARAVNRFDVVGATRVLRQALKSSRKPSHKEAARMLPGFKSKANDAGSLWLEYHFGWKPLVEDVKSSMELLEADFAPRKLRGKGKSKAEFHNFRYDPPDQPNGNGHDWSRWTIDHWYSVKASVGCEVWINNPNLNLWAAMGFTDPALVLNELVPYSFVLDWFSNWSQWLGQYSEFYGLELKYPWHTAVAYTTSSYNGQGAVFGFGSPPPHWDQIGSSAVSATGLEVLVWRRTNIPEVTLGLRLPERISLVRAATSIALLLGVMPRN